MKINYLLLCLFLLTGCEKVIDIDLPAEPSRLVVDANLSYIKGSDGKNQSIFLSTTTDYFDKDIPKVSGAIVYVNNSSNAKFEFIEETTQKGKYTCANFVPVMGENYTLTIVYNGETYKAQEKLTSVNKIEDIEQRSDLGINKDEYGIKVNFVDPATEDNFYVISYATSFDKFPAVEVFNDQFFQGKIGFGLFGSDKLKMGDKVEVRLQGTSERYFNYIKKITSTAVGAGGPFQPMPSSNIRGNLVNQTKPSNYCLGYFNVSETDKFTYTIQ